MLWSAAPRTRFLNKPLRHLLNIVLIATLTFLCMRLVKAVRAVISMHPAMRTNNLRARSVHTQSRVFSRVVMSTSGLVGVASILMTFPGVRQIEASLLAYAGVAGLVAGIAAQPVLGNLIAGLQIALTQPIRIDDVLIVKGEWGRVEEITGSYVVVRIWDDRRYGRPTRMVSSSIHSRTGRRAASANHRVGLSLRLTAPCPSHRCARRLNASSTPRRSGMVGSASCR